MTHIDDWTLIFCHLIWVWQLVIVSDVCSSEGNLISAVCHPNESQDDKTTQQGNYAPMSD